MKLLSILIASTVWVLSLATGLPADQTTVPKNPELIIRSVAGRDLFEFYCASCHGRDGRGAGHVAPALKVQPAGPHPADLNATGEYFLPQGSGLCCGAKLGCQRLRTDRARCPSGPESSKASTIDDEVNAARIENLVKYLESIQTRARADRRDGVERPAGTPALSADR